MEENLPSLYFFLCEIPVSLRERLLPVWISNLSAPVLPLFSEYSVDHCMKEKTN